MKTFKSLSELCEEVLKGKDLANPKNDEVGKLPDELFGETPELDDEGPDKAKLKEGPSQKLTSGTSSKQVEAKESKKFEGSKPAEEPETESPEDTEEPEDVLPKKMKKQLNDNFTMSAFETLFKKTITENIGEEPEMETSETTDDVASEMEDEIDDTEVDETEEEVEAEDDGDLVSDLQALHDQIGKIISRLTSEAEQESEEESEGEYTEEDFDEEFGEEEEEGGEETPVKESKEMKPLSNEHGKKMAKKGMNKVGKLKPKHAKSHSGTVKVQPKPSAVANKKGQMLQKGASVKTKVDKGDSFFD